MQRLNHNITSVMNVGAEGGLLTQPTALAFSQVADLLSLQRVMMCKLEADNLAMSIPFNPSLSLLLISFFLVAYPSRELPQDGEGSR